METNRGYTKDMKLSILDMKKELRHVKIFEWSVFIKVKMLMLFNEYKECHYNEYHFCCHGNEYPCWVDTEGEDFGWMFLNYENDSEGIRKALLEEMLSIVDQSKFEDCKIVIGEDKHRAEILIVNKDDSNYHFFFNN